jgi:RNA polymerase sigma-70 factor (ECF subfamily)
VRNLCFNKRRSKRTRVEQPLDSFDDGRLGPFVQLEGSELERKQEVELLRRAVALLPVEARELIVLRFMEEMSYGDIARTMGGSEASLRGKVFRSLKLLRDALEKKGISYAV